MISCLCMVVVVVVVVMVMVDVEKVTQCSAMTDRLFGLAYFT